MTTPTLKHYRVDGQFGQALVRAENAERAVELAAAECSTFKDGDAELVEVPAGEGVLHYMTE